MQSFTNLDHMPKFGSMPRTVVNAIEKCTALAAQASLMPTMYSPSTPHSALSLITGGCGKLITRESIGADVMALQRTDSLLQNASLVQNLLKSSCTGEGGEECA